MPKLKLKLKKKNSGVVQLFAGQQALLDSLMKRINVLEYYQRNPEGYGATLYSEGNLSVHQVHGDKVVFDGMYLPEGDWNIKEVSRRGTCSNVYVTCSNEIGQLHYSVLEGDTFKELPS